LQKDVTAGWGGREAAAAEEEEEAAGRRAMNSHSPDCGVRIPSASASSSSATPAAIENSWNNSSKSNCSAPRVGGSVDEGRMRGKM
jgi:hypothetical protein